MALAQSWGAPPRPREGGPSGLAEVLDVLLDKGLVLDAFVRVSLVGIELLTIDARVVIASVDTYLHFAEAVNRLDLYAVGQAESLPQLFRGGAKRKAQRAIEGGDDEDEGDSENNDEEQEGESSDESSGGLLSKVRERGKWN